MATWKAGTCGTTELDRTSCIVDLDSQTFLFTCPAHSILSLAGGTRLAGLEDENKRGWGNVQQEIYASVPNPNPALLDSLIITWTWSGTAPNRVLTVAIRGVSLNNQQKNNVQQKLDVRFGTGKVVATFP